MMRSKRNFALRQLEEFYNPDRANISWSLMEKQIRMTQWKIENTPGFLGGILSAYRYFPLDGMEVNKYLMLNLYKFLRFVTFGNLICLFFCNLLIIKLIFLGVVYCSWSFFSKDINYFRTK